jgi:hemerythrin superfamily protein
MKASQLLKKQHREVEKLFATALETEDPKARRRTMAEIKSALEHHTGMEEELFYPAVRELGTKKAEDMIGEAYEEHHVVKLMLAELPNVDPSEDAFEYLVQAATSGAMTPPCPIASTSTAARRS